MVKVVTAQKAGVKLTRWLLNSSNEVQPEPDPSGFDFMDSRTFLRRDFRQEWLINGAMVARQPLVIGGPRKALKTSICVDLAVSLASGKPFLDHFVVPKAVRVGIMSGESGGATLKETFQRIAASKMIEEPERLPIHWSLEVPSLSDERQLQSLAEAVKAQQLSVVVIDPLYLALLRGNPNVQASNLYDVGPLLSDVAKVCIDAGATPVILHHFRKGQSFPGKGGEYQPPDLDDLAFAGISEFARQWMLIGRRKRYDPESGEHCLWLSIGGSAGQSSIWGVDVREGRLNNDFSGRSWNVTVRTQSQQIERDNQQKNETQRVREADEEAKASEKILQALRETPEGLTPNQLVTRAGMGRKRVDSVTKLLVEQGRIEKTVAKILHGRSRRETEVFRLAAPENDPDEDDEHDVDHDDDDNDAGGDKPSTS